MGEVRLRILTFNTHLMAQSNVVVGAWAQNKLPVNLLDDLRQSYIIKKIWETEPDIVALQEVWAKDRMKAIQRLLSPYHGANGAEGDNPLSYLAEYVYYGVPARAASSGLVLLSKLPLKDVRFHLFENPHDSEELAASKGVLTATIFIGSEPLRLGMTHAWTDAGGLRNITDLINWTARGYNTSMVMMGDFNIHRLGERKKFADMDRIMNQIDAQDSWTLAHGTNTDGSETDDAAHNNLSQFFSPMRNTEPADCIDYVYVRSFSGLPLKVVDAKVLKDWKCPTDNATPKWYWVHPGTVQGMPAATSFGPNREKLCVVTRDTNNALRVAVCDQTNRWTSSLIGMAHGSPGLAWWNNALHLFFQGVDRTVMKVESQDGLNWSNVTRQPFESSGGCCALVFLNNLHVFVRRQMDRQIGYYVSTGGEWSNPKWIGLDTDHNISAAANNDRICVVVKKQGSQPSGSIMNVLIDRHGRSSSPGAIAAGAITSGSPGVAAIGGNFVVFYREPNGGGIWVRNTADNWRTVGNTYHATNDEVCPVTWGDKTLLFFSKPVWNTRKELPGKLSYPDDAVLYPERAFTHGYWPPDIAVDLSDHYPYQVDLMVSV